MKKKQIVNFCSLLKKHRDIGCLNWNCQSCSNYLLDIDKNTITLNWNKV